MFIPKGLYHCPLNFRKINDPKKPFLFHMTFSFHQNMRERLKGQLTQGGRKGDGKKEIREIHKETLFQG